MTSETKWRRYLAAALEEAVNDDSPAGGSPYRFVELVREDLAQSPLGATDEALSWNRLIDAVEAAVEKILP